MPSNSRKKRFPTSKVNRWITVGAVKSRSYVFQPYTMVKDLRTGFEMGNIGAVMDGDLNGFINAYLKAASLGTLKNKNTALQIFRNAVFS